MAVHGNGATITRRRSSRNPFASYGPLWSNDNQLYAAAGYVVVYANPRGSTSYGDEFANLMAVA